MPFRDRVKMKSMLVVEDDETYIDLVKMSLRKVELNTDVTILDDGQKALDYLNEKASDDSAELPDIILLDLQLPNVDGYELLETIKTEERTQLIPVIVISTEADEDSIKRCYSLNANCFVSKPTGVKEFIELMAAIKAFWANFTILPTRI